jgi:hypothetical protein
MMKIKSALSLVFTFTAVSFGLLIRVPAVYAVASLNITPDTMTMAANATTTFSVSINTDTTPVFGSDAIVSYPSSLVDIVSVTKGDYFTDFSYSAANGIMEIHGYFASLYDFKAGTGNLATIVVRPKQASSTSTLTIECNVTAQTSQIIDSTGKNILLCANVNHAVITTTANPTDTSVPTNTTAPGQPTATSTPGSYNDIAPSCNSLTVSPVSGYKPLYVNFSCAGSDADNDITTAEFTFGDGNMVTVDKNVGQFGSIPTSYRYSTAGIFSVSCRLKDNNQKFSDTPDVCRKNVTVKNRVLSTVAPTPRPTILSDSASPLVPTAIPTVGFGSRVALVPYASPTAFSLPEPTIAIATSGFSVSSIPWYVLGIVVGIIILIILLLRYLGRNTQQPPIVQ